MLNYECRKILKILNELNPHSVTSVSFYGIVNSFRKKKQGRWALRLDTLLPYLKTNGYITYISYNNTFAEIKLTYKGLAYKSFSAEELKDFIFKSILVPILVSLITGIFTN